MARPADARLSRRERRALERSERAEHSGRWRDRSRGRSDRSGAPWRSPVVLVSIAALALAAAAIVALVAKPPSTEGEIVLPATRYPQALVDGNAVGRADAPVVIEVYSDFQCRICGRFAREYLPRLVTDFVDDGRLRVVSRDIDILGAAPSESLAAAVAAGCAGAQGRYWPFHDVLFWNQAGENLGGFSTDRLARMADRIGLERRAWDACVADPASAATVRTTTAQAAALGVNSTPTFSINGQLARGLPPSYDALATVVTQLATGSPPIASPSAP